MTLEGAADLVVVGAGVIGLGVAWRAAQRGMAVTVVDDGGTRKASWAAAGMLAPVAEVWYGEEALLQVNLEASRRWPGFAAEVADAAGRDIGYRRCGTLLVARDADEHTALDELFSFQAKLGLDVERLRSREVRRLEPGLSPRVRGGILVEGDHQVDNRALLPALRHAAERAGARFEDGRVVTVTTNGDRVRGVELEDTRDLAGDAVVLAAGTGSAEIGGLPGGTVPVRPVKGQLVHLRGPADPLIASRTIRALGIYVVPREDGRVVVGATVEERRDTEVTAGGVFQLLRDAWELLPDVAELELVETVAGLRPGSPDNAPLLGPAGPAGLIVATGHYRNGMLLAPVTADAIAELLDTGRVPELIAPFSPDRFGAGFGS
jgi:glycine oxidase